MANKLLGGLLLALGILLLLGWIHVDYLTTILGIALIIVGVLVLLRRLSGARWLGVLVLVLGIVVLFPGVPFARQILGILGDLLVTIVAIILIIVGTLMFVGRM
ncbi:MAG: hypothetical protein ACYDDF_04490 [Thermoplasmatota archaeon]